MLNALCCTDRHFFRLKNISIPIYLTNIKFNDLISKTMKLLNSMFIYPFMISGLSFGLSVSAIAADYITEESTEQLEDNYTQQQLAKLYLENLDLP